MTCYVALLCQQLTDTELPFIAQPLFVRCHVSFPVSIRLILKTALQESLDLLRIFLIDVGKNIKTLSPNDQ